MAHDPHEAIEEALKHLSAASDEIAVVVLYATADERSHTLANARHWQELIDEAHEAIEAFVR